MCSSDLRCGFLDLVKQCYVLGGHGQFVVITFLSQRANVKHLATSLHICVVAPNDFAFAGESRHRQIVKIQKLRAKITSNSYEWRDIKLGHMPKFLTPAGGGGGGCPWTRFVDKDITIKSSIMRDAIVRLLHSAPIELVSVLRVKLIGEFEPGSFAFFLLAL